ncbi:PorP/SprF family type IX secretion system membrane protein [Membranihabitans maritimus]|uniref:PorP/SprF family type IX secretion system membrane protein n=1 Tax=Membranihabitans maritimus TaxID=2904244 RepID=UPI001F24F367|nr:PorP/SprF family type IX secretion system membrane protein [Membranihabitans maritimus]
MIREITIFFTISCIFFICIESTAQDFSYTQSFAHTSTLNPSMTGLHNGQYKTSLLYRNQWIRAVEEPFTMIGGYVDLRSKIPIKLVQNDAFGIGLGFISESQGIIEYKKNVFNINAAYHKALDYNGDHTLSAGFQLGFMQNTVGYENITFFDQFDGNGFNLATNEDLPRNALSATDLGVGISYQYNFDVHLFALGASVFHANSPELSFGAQDQSTLSEYENKLYRKYVVFSYYQWFISNDLSLTPRIITKMQGPNTLTSVGGTARIRLSGIQENAVHFGMFVHSGKTVNSSFKPHTLSLLAGYEFNNFNLGLSYDLGMVNQYNWAKSRGNFELSLTYFGLLEGNSGVGCPVF